VTAAVALADRGGLDALSMRHLADTLGVEAMSLYHHVASKDELLDAMVDAVFAEMALPPGGVEWRTALRERACSARAALARHPWAVGLLESRRSPGPATLRQHDAVIGCLRSAGFPLALTAHAYAALDSYVYGFALQEATLPFRNPRELEEVAAALLPKLAGAFPHLAELAREHVLRPGYAFADEFEFGLELLLDGLERQREGSR
jgi:AcrR family transcriptional regulator